MKTIIVFLALLLSANVFAVEAYVEYKSQLNYQDSRFVEDVNHFRFGVQAGKFHGELGPVTGRNGSGVSGQIGYNFNFTKKLSMSGNWEGIKRRGVFDHTLETQIRYTF